MDELKDDDEERPAPRIRLVSASTSSPMAVAKSRKSSCDLCHHRKIKVRVLENAPKEDTKGLSFSIPSKGAMSEAVHQDVLTKSAVRPNPSVLFFLHTKRQGLSLRRGD